MRACGLPVRWRSLLYAVATMWVVAPAGAAAEPDALPLRLSDLAPGYVVADDSGCGLRFGDEGLPGVLRALERDYRYAACAMEFERLWRSAEAPPLIESYAFEFERPEGADAGFRAGRALIAYATGVPGAALTRQSVRHSLGDATAVYHTDDALVRGRRGRPGIAVLWRAGRVLALVFVAGRGIVDGDEAFALAGVQQGRVVAPTPLAPADNDDREVALDHPRLGLPVWWLGDRFPAQGSLPELVLENTWALGQGPGWRAAIDYASTQGGAGVTLGLWPPRAFARFKRTRLGRLVRRQRCARRTPVGVPGGRAVIYAGYVHPPRHCGRRAPDRYLAHVFLDDAVITVNLPVCLLCVRGVDGDPYNTKAGIRAVVQGLQARP